MTPEQFIERVKQKLEHITGLPVGRNVLPDGNTRLAQHISVHKLRLAPAEKQDFPGAPKTLEFLVRLVGKDKSQPSDAVMEPIASAIINQLTESTLDYACVTLSFIEMRYVTDDPDHACVPLELIFAATLQT